MALLLPEQTSWVFGARSEAELAPVVPRLQCVARLALAICIVDFGIYDGGRELDEQAALVAAGKSRALVNPKHVIGEAVDAVAWVKGHYTWDDRPSFRVATAWQAASRFLRIPVVWGGVWDRTLSELGNLETAHGIYCERFQRANPGRKPLVDLVHFQTATPPLPIIAS